MISSPEGERKYIHRMPSQEDAKYGELQIIEWIRGAKQKWIDSRLVALAFTEATSPLELIR
jgi:hypothetical protein